MKRTFFLLLMISLLISAFPAEGAQQSSVFFDPNSGFLRVNTSIQLEEIISPLQFQLFPNAQVTSLWVPGLETYRIDRTPAGTVVTLEINTADDSGTLELSYEGFLSTEAVARGRLDQEINWFPLFDQAYSLESLEITVPEGFILRSPGIPTSPETRTYSIFMWEESPEAKYPVVHFIPASSEDAKGLPELEIAIAEESEIALNDQAEAELSDPSLETLASQEVENDTIEEALAELPERHDGEFFDSVEEEQEKVHDEELIPDSSDDDGQTSQDHQDAVQPGDTTDEEVDQITEMIPDTEDVMETPEVEEFSPESLDRTEQKDIDLTGSADDQPQPEAEAIKEDIFPKFRMELTIDNLADIKSLRPQFSGSLTEKFPHEDIEDVLELFDQAIASRNRDTLNKMIHQEMPKREQLLSFLLDLPWEYQQIRSEVASMQPGDNSYLVNAVLSTNSFTEYIYDSLWIKDETGWKLLEFAIKPQKTLVEPELLEALQLYFDFLQELQAGEEWQLLEDQLAMGEAQRSATLRFFQRLAPDATWDIQSASYKEHLVAEVLLTSNTDTLQMRVSLQPTAQRWRVTDIKVRPR